MDPTQALDMLRQVVQGIKLPYNEHVLLEKSADVLQAVLKESPTTEEPILFEEPSVSPEPQVQKPSRRGGRRNQ